MHRRDITYLLLSHPYLQQHKIQQQQQKQPHDSILITHMWSFLNRVTRDFTQYQYIVQTTRYISRQHE